MDENDEVFAAMGSALTRWSMVDRSLTVIYAVAVNPRKPAMAAASIWRVTGHSLKVEMTETALEALFIEYEKGDPTAIRESWKKAKKSMSKAVKGRNDLGHSALYGVTTEGRRKSVLQKDREKFRSLRQGRGQARHFDADYCKSIERDCFVANIDLIKILTPLDDFFRENRVVMREDDAFPENIEEFFTKRNSRRRKARRANRA